MDVTLCLNKMLVYFCQNKFSVHNEAMELFMQYNVEHQFMLHIQK
jgi:hypothetical protein